MNEGTIYALNSNFIAFETLIGTTRSAIPDTPTLDKRDHSRIRSVIRRFLRFSKRLGISQVWSGGLAGDSDSPLQNENCLEPTAIN